MLMTVLHCIMETEDEGTDIYNLANYILMG